MNEKNDLSIRKDLVMAFGDRDDGVVGIPGLTADGQVIETSYFFGRTKPKNIIVISSQAGCPMGCTFCELGSERFARNLTPEEMRDQVVLMLPVVRQLHGFDIRTTPHKITVANSGEPLLNPRLVEGLGLLSHLPVSFKVSTIFPDSPAVWRNLERLAEFSSGFPRPLQLQISLISTSEKQRRKEGRAKVASFAQIREAAEFWRTMNPSDRKVNLSLILTADMPVDVEDVAATFPPDLFRFRFRNYVPTANGRSHGLATIEQARLAAIKDAFAAKGYEVGDWATPTPTELKFDLAANSIRKRYLDMISK